jgi:hypothetical protein
MTAPSTYLRELREGAARRRLELAKLLRDDPTATNISLAKSLGVNRETIALDRKAIMETLTKSTLSETELLRTEMVKKLDGLITEVEKHRKDGKLSLSAIDQMLSITKALVELTGCRKPVNEKLDVRHRTFPMFRGIIIGGPQPSPDHVWSEPDRGWIRKDQLIKEPLTLEATNETR